MKLKVGDIEIDSRSGVLIGGSANTSNRVQPGASPPSALEVLRAFTPRAYRIFGTLLGVVSLCAAAVVVPAVLQGSLPWLALLSLLPTSVAASSSFVVAHFVSSLGLHPSARDVQLTAERASRVRAHLLSASSAETVEEIARALGWSNEAVAAGLVELVARGQVAEDIDLDSGHWLYRLDDDEKLRLPEAAQGTRRASELTGAATKRKR